MNIKEVFVAEHNDCIHESAYAIISIHKTEKGAYFINDS